MKSSEILRRLSAASRTITVGLEFLQSPADAGASGLHGMQTEERNTLRPIADVMRATLGADLATWFPRCIDHEYGGFFCDFDAAWQLSGAQDKMLEFQTRQTRAAAEAALFDPELIDCHAAAVHGFEYLKNVLWDTEYGGFYHRLDRTGTVLWEGCKNGHGTGFAIEACISHHRLTGDNACLELARQAFAWLEDHARDAEHGGYFGLYQRDGTPILSATDSPLDYPIGTPRGLKDASTTVHLLEALADLHAVAPGPVFAERIAELSNIITSRLITVSGLLYKRVARDWTPVAPEVEFGYALQLSQQLHKASAVQNGREDLDNAARLLVDASLRHAWDHERGGFYIAGFADHIGKSIRAVDRGKYWWVQAEGLRALLDMAERYDDASDWYLENFRTLWRYVDRYVIDHAGAGWWLTGRDMMSREFPKASEWKDASHEVRALIACAEGLRKVDATDAPASTVTI